MTIDDDDDEKHTCEKRLNPAQIVQGINHNQKKMGRMAILMPE
nr:hypothetical protein [Erwinia amylovora]